MEDAARSNIDYALLVVIETLFHEEAHRGNRLAGKDKNNASNEDGEKAAGVILAN